MKKKFDIIRTELPSWLKTLENCDTYDRFGEQLEWAFAVPWTFEILASPNRRHTFIRAPREGDTSMPVATGYWMACLNLLIYGFGWSSPGRGLRWWYENGCPNDDPKLSLLKQLWGADGQLEWLALWLWTKSQFDFYNGVRSLVGQVGQSEPQVPDFDWLPSTWHLAKEGNVPNPMFGGNDSLHLSRHIDGPVEPPRYGTPPLVYDPAGKRPSLLVLDSMVGWYRALFEAGSALVTDEDMAKSAEVDVVVTTVGHLGTYRYSEQSGLWYSGKLDHHLAGN